MKKIWFFLALVLVLSACTSGQHPAVSGNPDLLEFPGVSWGSGKDTVLSALGIADNQILADEEVGVTSGRYRMWTVAVSDMDCFGFATQHMVFRFYDYSGAGFGLGGVDIFFPDTQDMAQVTAALAEQYGEGADAYTLYTATATGLDAYEIQLEEGSAWWQSKPAPSAYLSQEIQDAYVQAVTQQSTSPIPEETAREYLDCAQLVTLSLTNSAYADLDLTGNPYMSHNMVSFSAAALLEFTQVYG